MRFVVGSDESRSIVLHIAAYLRERGHDVKMLPIGAWGAVAIDVAKSVAAGDADHGIVCCWTGTGVSIAANKVPGVRAALCVDAATAAGARKWNDANVLALSLRLLSEPVADEIIDAWLAASYGEGEDASLEAIDAISKLADKL